MEEDFSIYPTSTGDGYPVAKMSKAYLRETIALIEKTGINKEFLPTLKEHLKKKGGLVFKNTDINK